MYIDERGKVVNINFKLEAYFLEVLVNRVSNL